MPLTIYALAIHSPFRTYAPHHLRPRHPRSIPHPRPVRTPHPGFSLHLFYNVEEMKKYLGEFEELVLSMVSILNDDAYGNAIVQKIAEALDRKVSLSAVHVTLYRLEDKGLVKSHHGEATAKRGGRRKRLFQITNTGKNMLRDMQSQRLKVWKLLPTLKIVGT